MNLLFPQQSLRNCLQHPRNRNKKGQSYLQYQRCTYNTYIFIGNQSDKDRRGGGGPPWPRGLWRRGGRKCISLACLRAPTPPGRHMNERRWEERPFRCSQHAQDGGAGGRGKTPELDSNLSTTSNMRGFPPRVSAGSSSSTASPTEGSPPLRPCLGPVPREASTQRTWWFGRLRSWGSGHVRHAVFREDAGALLTAEPQFLAVSGVRGQGRPSWR